MNKTASRRPQGGGSAQGDGAPAGDEAADRRAQPGAGGLERPSDHRAEMEEIARELARLSVGSPAGGRDARGPGRDGLRATLRGAAAEIALRQAHLDGPETSDDLRLERLRTDRDPGPPPAGRAAGPGPWTPETAPRTTAPSTLADEAAERRPQNVVGFGKPDAGLAAEVSQTFARFAQDIREAVRATDARPSVEALDREVRQIGRAVNGTEGGLASADSVARVGEQTREVRDLLKAASDRPVPFDGLAREITALERRIGRLATTPAVPPPDFAGTIAEVRALLDGFKPGATIATLETRLDDITDRIGAFDARGHAGLIEGLSRRVDEVHSSLRSQLAEASVDTRPLESLVLKLAERIDQAREASADFRQLESSMRDAAARVESAGTDPRGIQAIETQLARVADQLGRSEASLRSLDGVEQSLGELFSQFEVTRQVAIDAAETAARTAARDTLRAALQNPSLASRRVDPNPALADQVARGLEDLRAQQDLSERRTLSTLADLRATVERLVRSIDAPAPRTPAEALRRERAVAPAIAEPKVAIDPSDLLIEPGAGRGAPVLEAEAVAPGAAEPRLSPGPAADLESDGRDMGGDGAASFIAAARRAAQAAQASAASAAAQQAAERRPAERGRQASGRMAAAADPDATLGRAKAFLAKRRRPMLLGLAIVVALVGALEIVRLESSPGTSNRAGAAESANPSAVRVAAAATQPVDPAPLTKAPPPSDEAVLPSASVAPARPPLPSFVTGPAKVQPSATAEGLPQGLHDLAAAGDAAAEYEVGLRYADGRGMARDLKQAAAWFNKAAAQGVASAEYRLGSAYEKGSGVDRDAALAVGWYAKAAEAGNVRAMHNLAVMSAEGAVGKPDYAKAAQWFGKASTYGVRDSQFNLAILYARGLGIEQSLAQSYTWFAIAAAEGDEDAGRKRDEVAAKLDASAMAAAKAAADAFRAAVPSAAANEVSAPSGGWDAASGRVSGASARVSQL